MIEKNNSQINLYIQFQEIDGFTPYQYQFNPTKHIPVLSEVTQTSEGWILVKGSTLLFKEALIQVCFNDVSDISNETVKEIIIHNSAVNLGVIRPDKPNEPKELGRLWLDNNGPSFSGVLKTFSDNEKPVSFDIENGMKFIAQINIFDRVELSELGLKTLEMRYSRLGSGHTGMHSLISNACPASI